MEKMKFFAFAILFALTLIAKSNCSEEEVSKNELNSSSFYTAAVLEFNPPGVKFTEPQDVADANLAEYLEWIDKAKEQGADIIVFSEASLNYYGINSRENLSQVAIELEREVPDISDCDYSYNAILSGLSFAASNASIYVLVNVVEMETCNETEACADGFKLFNTNLVFDRKGCLISRYRKFNLFIEPEINVPEDPEMSTFTTDFGVTFGHFVCFDILFKSPALDLIQSNISHILYPSMWFSEIPFYTSVQIQQSFAQANNIVLLSSGTNDPKNANTGSGIFVGRHGAVQKLISYKNESRMMIAEVPKNVDDPDFVPKEPSIDPYTPVQMDSLKLNFFTPQNTYPLQEHFVATSGNVTCEFTIKMANVVIPPGRVGYFYKITMFSGVRSFAGLLNGGEIHCAIVACTDDNDIESCGRKLSNSENLMPSVVFYNIRIKLTINGDADGILVMPTSLDASVNPLDANEYDFTRGDNNEFFMDSPPDKVDLDDLLTFGIYGRNYNLDGPIDDEMEQLVAAPEESVSQPNTEIHPGSEDEEVVSLSLKMTVFVSLMVVLSILAAIMTYRKLKHPYVVPDQPKRKSCGSILG